MQRFLYDMWRNVRLWEIGCVVVTLALATFITYITGGTTNVFPHLFYLPVVIAATVYLIRGGIIAGVLAGVLCGPWMPQNVALGIRQTPENWLVRLVFFAAIGALTGVLARGLRNRIRELSDLNDQTIHAFVEAIDSKDPYTAEHSTHVARFAGMIAQEMRLPPSDVARIRGAALLHDVGKIGIPASILNKPGKLTDTEYDIIKQHPLQSVKIIQCIDQYVPYIPGVRHHHERIDGNGYPDGIAGADISLDARIISVADAYEAMTADRAYRAKLPPEEAIRRLREGAGCQFDADVVDALVSALKRQNRRRTRSRWRQHPRDRTASAGR